MLFIVPFPDRRQSKPRFLDIIVIFERIFIHTILFIRCQHDPMMEWASLGMPSGKRDIHCVHLFTITPFQISGMFTNLSLRQSLIRSFKTFLAIGQNIEYIKHDRSGCSCAHQFWFAFTGSVSDPNTNGVLRGHTDRPSITEAKTCSRFPSHPLNGRNGFPINLLRTIHFQQSRKCQPRCTCPSCRFFSFIFQIIKRFLFLQTLHISRDLQFGLRFPQSHRWIYVFHQSLIGIRHIPESSFSST